MKCRDLLDRIEEKYPLDCAYGWDNVGLLAGDDQMEVQKVYIALDATDEVIAHAIACGADLLLTHHPLIFEPVRKVTNEHFITNRILTLLQNKVSYYAMHTNYDVLKMADLAGNLLELLEVEPLEYTNVEQGIGLGKLGVFQVEKSLKDCGEKVKRVFGLDTVKIFGDLEQKVKKVAIVPGSGKSTIETAIAKGVEVLITGDIGHHDGIDAKSRGLNIIDAGHYGIEHIFIEDMKSFLEEHKWGVLVATEEIKHPFEVV